MDGAHVISVTWPSEAYREEFWRRVKEAKAKGLPLVALPERTEQLPEFLELYKRYMLLCGIVIKAAMPHKAPCACMLCQVVDAWLNADVSSEMLEKVLRAPASGELGGG